MALASNIARISNCEIILHTGDLVDSHWNHLLFDDFEMYVFKTSQNQNIPQLKNNWHILDENNCLLEFDGVKFYMNHNLGMEVLQTKMKEILDDLSRVQVWQMTKQIRDKYGYVDYVLFGHSHHVFLHCDHGIVMLNPGAWFKKLMYVVIVIDLHKAMDIQFKTLTKDEQRVLKEF